MKQTFEYHIENINIPYQDPPNPRGCWDANVAQIKPWNRTPMRWAILFTGSKCSASARKAGSW
ncbi:hypothetical protein L346_05651 [Pseudomonas aeruginosa MSH-10]|nr:hypothetical protein L346_05651 [Pseudomonas aeruginosa MSH-10]ERX75872.1 hypothetical protein P999_00205 [Pseudomonas aeruginosa MSH3]ERZ37145.1 hypothetical protein Q000_04195 [Pseudomonas aeruginosa MSH10]KSL43833.1 hypothetical protein APA56_13165 [Pseudomonas aeruginosa]MDV6604783.1 hypothetical protein [Pseudomonas aeruginosa]